MKFDPESTVKINKPNELPPHLQGAGETNIPVTPLPEGEEPPFDPDDPGKHTLARQGLVEDPEGRSKFGDYNTTLQHNENKRTMGWGEFGKGMLNTAVRGVPIAGQFMPQSQEGKDLQYNHPMWSATADVAGSLPFMLVPGAAVGKIAQGARFVPRLLAQMGAGGAAGASLSGVDTIVNMGRGGGKTGEDLVPDIVGGGVAGMLGAGAAKALAPGKKFVSGYSKAFDDIVAASTKKATGKFAAKQGEKAVASNQLINKKLPDFIAKNKRLPLSLGLGIAGPAIAGPIGMLAAAAPYAPSLARTSIKNAVRARYAYPKSLAGEKGKVSVNSIIRAMSMRPEGDTPDKRHD